MLHISYIKLLETIKEDIHFHPMTIHEKNNEAEKKEYMVAFTRLEEAHLGPAANTCTIKAGSLFNIVLFIMSPCYK